MKSISESDTQFGCHIMKPKTGKPLCFAWDIVHIQNDLILDVETEIGNSDLWSLEMINP